MLEIIVEVCFSFAIFKTDFGGLVWLKYDDYTFHPQEIPGEYGWWVYAPRAETVGVKCAYETELLNLFRGYAETPRKRDKEYKPIPLLKKLHKELFKGS
jgi:hypothetical protein